MARTLQLEVTPWIRRPPLNCQTNGRCTGAVRIKRKKLYPSFDA